MKKTIDSFKGEYRWLSNFHLAEVEFEGIKYPDLRTKLLETGAVELIEGNTWHDNEWGSCICEKCNNTGKNNLGKLLMKIREELK